MNNREYAEIVCKELQAGLGAIDPAATEQFLDLLLGADEIFCAGAGRSGFQIRGFAMRLMHMGRKSYMVGETCTPNITDQGLLVVCSGSGTTKSLVNHAMKAKEVGAKVALAILSVLTPEQVALSVSLGDSKSLTKASGVGNKLAQRIILELKDKIKKLGIGEPMSGEMDVPAGTAPVVTGNLSQAIAALAVLGYTPDDVMPFLSGIDTTLPVETIIAQTLKAIGKK